MSATKEAKTVKVEITQDVAVRVTYTLEMEEEGNEQYIAAARLGQPVGEYPIPEDLFIGDRNPEAKLIAAKVSSIYDFTEEDKEPMDPTIRIVE